MVFPTYQVATRCTGSATPGSQALMKWSLDAGLCDRNMGIYNCRDVRGTSGMYSLHAEGRAGDHGVNTDSKGRAKGRRLVETLRPVAKELGIQCMIFDRHIWSAKSPGKDGRPYTGVNPHYDHAHIELTRNAAANLTIATIKHVLEKASKPAVTPAPVKPKPGKKVVKLGSRALRRGSKGKDVLYVQKFIGHGVKPDGVYGAKTEAAVRWWQDRHNLAVDGSIGPRDWAKILGKKK